MCLKQQLLKYIYDKIVKKQRSELKVNIISPATSTSITLGDSGDTFNIPSGATIANSGTATGYNSAGAFDLNGAELTLDANANTSILQIQMIKQISKSQARMISQ